MAAVALENLTFSYPNRKTPALRGVTLSVKEGELAVLCGKSGCGKTTLLRQCKPALAPHGEKSGEIRLFGQPIAALSPRDQAAKIGFVLQNPDNQLVTDKVWHELAFGLESLGVENNAIRLRVAEMASFFGIGPWFHKNVADLSGGQKQLLNLASIMAMQPHLLLLDEPTSQLDPIAAAEFLQTVRKINRELGVTVLLTEHRLEEAVPMADRVVVLDEGRILVDAPPKEAGERLKALDHDMFASMPAPMQIYAALDAPPPCPLTVREGRQFLSNLFRENPPKVKALPDSPAPKGKGEPALELKDVWFRYEKNGPDVIKDLSLTVEKGSIFAVMGQNGAGKTTLLTLLTGQNRPLRGKVRIRGKEIGKYKAGELFDRCLAMLPQNPQALFVKKTIREDLMEMLQGYGRQSADARLLEMAKLTQIEDLLNAHPYDVSGGEQQRAALAKVLLLEPQVLLLDEPTKGLDNHYKEILSGILTRLCGQGVTVLLVSHDIEFCAKYAHQCALFFDGSIVSQGEPKAFFSGNRFYTTAANRMARHLFAGAVTNEEVIALCRQNGVSPSKP